MTCDIPGASSAKLCGSTSGGFFVDEDRRDWPYSTVAFAHEVEALFEQPPPPPPPPPPEPTENPEFKELVHKLKSVGFSHAQRHRILKRAKSSGTLDHMVPQPEPKPIGKYTFEERVWRQHSVETHLGTPGVDLKVMRRPLKPIDEPPPRPKTETGHAMPRTIPFNSIHNQPQLRAFNASHLSIAPAHWSSNDPRSRRPKLVPQERAPPQWPKPALDTPAAARFEGRPLDRSLSTHDIRGAKPRQLGTQCTALISLEPAPWYRSTTRLSAQLDHLTLYLAPLAVSDVSRAGLWRLHAYEAKTSFVNGL